jgi:hypothetical protein
MKANIRLLSVGLTPEILKTKLSLRKMLQRMVTDVCVFEGRDFDIKCNISSTQNIVCVCLLVCFFHVIFKINRDYFPV